jgi:hypothetical protein
MIGGWGWGVVSLFLDSLSLFLSILTHICESKRLRLVYEALRLPVYEALRLLVQAALRLLVYEALRLVVYEALSYYVY